MFGMPSKSIFLVAPRDKSTPEGVFGEFHDDKGNFICYSLEKPWLNNEKRVSCIPAGTYICKKYLSPTKGQVYWLQDTLPRTMIEIHSANVHTELLGCIAPGLGFSMFDIDTFGELCSRSGRPAAKRIKGVTRSREALQKLKLVAGWPSDFTLTIV